MNFKDMIKNPICIPLGFIILVALVVVAVYILLFQKSVSNANSQVGPRSQVSQPLPPQSPPPQSSFMGGKRRKHKRKH